MRGVVALAPVACLDLAYKLDLSNDAVSGFLGGGQEQAPAVYEAACPSRHALKTPAILVHGALDETVPVSLSRRFLERQAADRENLRLVEIAGAEHMDLVDPESAAWATVLDCVLHMIQTKLHDAAMGVEYGPFLATHSGLLLRSLIAIRTTRARPQGECTPQPALSLLQLRQVTTHEQSRSAPIDIFQAINAGAELVQQTILNSPALLCDRIRNAMECNHGILGRV
jgi:hypothetical protein